MTEKIRFSEPTIKVLKHLLEAPKGRRSGTSIAKTTGVSSGTLYPLLRRLETAKWIEGEWEAIDPSKAGRPRSHLYKLTLAGQVAAQRFFLEFQPSILWRLTRI
jgi:PadR family transcriptional regulator, regulatory protein PadR